MQACQYAVKFICGEAKGKILAPGEYWTAINVLNPTHNTVKFRKTISIGFPGEEPGKVVVVEDEAKLGRYQALEIDREDIEEHARNIIEGLSPPYKGFVIIDSPEELDVVAVYTAIGKEASLAMHVERVLPRLGWSFEAFQKLGREPEIQAWSAYNTVEMKSAIGAEEATKMLKKIPIQRTSMGSAP